MAINMLKSSIVVQPFIYRNDGASTSSKNVSVIRSQNSSFVSGRVQLTSSNLSCKSGRTQLQVMAKGRSQNRKLPGKGDPSGNFQLPPIDPDNPQFMLYVRSKMVPQWYPLSVVTGGSQAAAMVKMAEGNFGKQFYTDALTRNVGGVIYKDMTQIRNLVFRSYPLLKKAKDLQWGYKLLDSENPRKSMMPTGVVLVPPEDEMKAPMEDAVGKVKNFFGSLGKK
mmetsp:Transcript_1469/g.2100  ORF Transcript_1469/g.2100 Transcript_1469/m.2100 type:complete len:223 (+) Transcript_1469:97-765(+)|eukprot:CAMPEP_0196578848 /NCGR_PEP_ID=MMETSP1081-20130531/10781_1 /TAXON_ID=36882 /ORGANISM="Pyramimonas amylifera, Strain CCMP720" /LENGTH=222 /DNA_ID=CAMNT_0041898215 /DNA_START=97 /DNA_END=765 /DNA_ORIENTATION=+